MAPLPDPLSSAEFCPNCRAPLPQPRPALCPNCGASLRTRPWWMTLLVSLVAIVLGLAGLCLGGFGACVAVFSSAEGGKMSSSDWLQILAIIGGGIVCGAAAIALLLWLLKKPKR